MAHSYGGTAAIWKYPSNLKSNLKQNMYNYTRLNKNSTAHYMYKQAVIHGCFTRPFSF